MSQQINERLDIHIYIHGQDQSGVMQQLAEIKKTLGDIKMTEQQVTDLLNKIDVTTNKTAANVQTLADVDQKISDELDQFIKANPAGTTLTDAQVTQLQGLADRSQANSDAFDSQITVLQGIAAKGQPVVPPATGTDPNSGTPTAPNPPAVP